MSSDLNEAVKQFDRVQANLGKLERLWSEIEPMLPSGCTVGFRGDQPEYRKLVRRFRHICEQMPRIDGFEIKCDFDDPVAISETTFEYSEVDDLFGHARYTDSLHEPGDSLDEYRLRLTVRRRTLIRDAVDQLCRSVEQLLVSLSETFRDRSPGEPVDGEEWEQLCNDIRSINALLGNAVQRPARWDDLMRHLGFAAYCDLNDILEHDWPAVRAGLENTLFSDDEPLPVDVKDLGELAASKPTGSVATELKWGSLTDAFFERLIFNLVARTDGYENPEWLTHTNAPDRGRDVSVWRLQRDSLASARRFRVIIACKKQKSVGLGDISRLKEQMALWEPPRVDELIVATIGRFTTDAIQYVEKHNQSNNALRIEMWPESHLERLLAERPELIAEFDLR